jgi:hypothetical protein
VQLTRELLAQPTTTTTMPKRPPTYAVVAETSVETAADSKDVIMVIPPKMAQTKLLTICTTRSPKEHTEVEEELTEVTSLENSRSVMVTGEAPEEVSLVVEVTTVVASVEAVEVTTGNLPALFKKISILTKK